MGYLRSRFPSAYLLFAHYFHEDFEGSPEEIVDQYVAETSRAERQAAASELSTILREFNSEETLGLILLELGDSFDVLRTKRSYRSWIGEIIERLNASDSAAAP